MVDFAPITLGRAVRVATSTTFVATETHHSPNTVLPAHSHENAAISFVIDGKRSYRFGSRSFDCDSRSMTFVPRGSVHRSRFSNQEGHGLILEVRLQDGVTAALFAEPHTSSSDSAAWVFDAIRREMATPDEVTPLALDSLGFELLVREIRCSKAGRGPAAWLLRIRETIHDGFKTPASLAVLAADAGVHRGQLTREFRRHFGVTIGEYIRARRASRAWDLVTRSDLSLVEIAGECGFADQSHLTRAFRRAYGTTPGRHRAEGRRAPPVPSSLLPFKTAPQRPL